MRCASHVKITSGKQQFVIDEYFPQQIVTLFTILDSNLFFLILLDNKKYVMKKKLKLNNLPSSFFLRNDFHWVVQAEMFAEQLSVSLHTFPDKALQ